MLQRALTAQCIRAGIAEVNEQIAWLENRGYVKATRLGDGGFISAHITRAGIDVALGNVRATRPRRSDMGQKSAVDKLPARLRKKLLDLLQDPGVSQREIVEAINAEAGDSLLSRSGVNRYALRMRKFAEKSRQAREVTEAYLARGGGDSRVSLGKAINEQIRIAVYDLMWELDDIKEKGEIDASAASDSRSRAC
ncbi:MAG: DUF3486 family protein [Treponematales bacterium]